MYLLQTNAKFQSNLLKNYEFFSKVMSSLHKMVYMHFLNSFTLVNVGISLVTRLSGLIGKIPREREFQDNARGQLYVCR